MGKPPRTRGGSSSDAGTANTGMIDTAGEMPAPAPIFSAWLKQRRKELDLTQLEVAERVGCSEDTIRKVEAGTRRLSKQVAELLAEVLHVPAEQRDTFTRLARSLSTGPVD